MLTPVTVEKGGKPFAVVQSYDDFRAVEQVKLEVLRQAIAEAMAELASGGGMPFDQIAVERTKAEGRRKLANIVAEE